MSFFNKIFGDPNKKVLKLLEEKVARVSNLEPEFQSLSDEELKSKLQSFKGEISRGRSTDEALFHVFALVREAAKRTVNMRHFDVQLMGGMVLHQGKIAEMKTGEGKTLAATLPIVLNALEGKGVHLVTVNDYLASRDAEWMGKVYNFLGLSVGVTLNGMDHNEKKQAYSADITYSTNNEYGFDYLRDNMVQDLSEKVQREHAYAIVDEVDSILIDEARTPLIISAPAAEATEDYYRFAKLVSQLVENEDYNVDEKLKSATLSEEGINKMENWLGVSNIYEDRGIRTVHHIEQALRAFTLFQIDRDYVVRDGGVVIVDEFTGRLMAGRRYSEGLHQAIEAKENVDIQRESMTLATITFQNFFRMYKKLSGMTGTAATEAEEFGKIYDLDVTEVPTHKPLIRDDQNDLIYKSEIGKFKAVATKVKDLNEKGQPVLIGTVSVDKSERLSEMLDKAQVKHHVLNAKNHQEEAEIVAQAGKKGSVTVATNMAGRGVDIVLGGSPSSEQESQTIKDVGGLFVIGTERHESRRIDNQLRGRSGRQGDPGGTQFYTSTEDDLMRLFGSDRMKSVMETMKIPDDMPIEHKIITRSIETAQKKVEGNNFDIRKHVVEYDDVINKHREVIYSRRKNILEAWDYQKKKLLGEDVKEPEQEKQLKFTMQDLIEKEIEQVVVAHTAKEHSEDWNLEEIAETMRTIFPVTPNLHQELNKLNTEKESKSNIAESRTAIIDSLNTAAKEEYSKKEQELGPDLMRQIEKTILLQSIDKLWVEHLEDISALREGIGLRGYGQRDPLIEYKKESFKLFQGLLDSIQNQVVYSIYKIGVAKESDTPMKKENLKTSSGKEDSKETKPKPIKKSESDKVGRNEPCSCGSGKKYKKCHGANT